MLAIDEEKLPPPKPASAASSMNTHIGVPGWLTNQARPRVGISSIAALKAVKARPPKRGMAKVYGMRSAAPTRVGVEVSSRALLTAVGLPWPRPSRKEKPAAPMLVTTVPQMTQTLKPRFSAKTEKLRFFLAVRFPPDSQNSVLSGSQWSSQRPRFWCVNAGDSECWPVAAAVAVI